MTENAPVPKKQSPPKRKSGAAAAKEKPPLPASKPKASLAGANRNLKPNRKGKPVKTTRGAYRSFPKAFVDDLLSDQEDPSRLVISEIIGWEDLKCKYAAWVIARSNNRKPEAAETVGISLRTVYNLADRWLERRRLAGDSKS